MWACGGVHGGGTHTSTAAAFEGHRNGPNSHRTEPRVRINYWDASPSVVSPCVKAICRSISARTCSGDIGFSGSSESISSCGHIRGAAQRFGWPAGPRDRLSPRRSGRLREGWPLPCCPRLGVRRRRGSKATGSAACCDCTTARSAPSVAKISGRGGSLALAVNAKAGRRVLKKNNFLKGISIYLINQPIQQSFHTGR